MLKLTMAMSMLVAGAAFSQVQDVKTLKCGGYISLEKKDNQSVIKIIKAGKSTCKSLQIESLGVNATLVEKQHALPLDLENVGSLLPVIVDDEVIVINIQQAPAVKVVSSDSGSQFSQEYETSTSYENTSSGVAEPKSNYVQLPSPASSNPALTDIERKRLEIEEKRFAREEEQARREKAQRAAKNAAAAAAAGAALGDATAKAIGGIER